MINYNKEYRKKDGRLLTASGPRALQNRPAYSDNDIADMKAEINRLKLLVGNSVDGVTHVVERAVPNDSVNDLINDTVSKALMEAETSNLAKITDYENKIEHLNSEIIRLNTELSFIRAEHHEQITSYEDRLYTLFKVVAKKDEIIGEMTSNLLTGGSSLVTRAKAEVPEETTVQRPNIDDVFIDPNKGGEDGMKSHVKIKEIKNDTDVSNSVDKLRGLLGKLPKK